METLLTQPTNPTLAALSTGDLLSAADLTLGDVRALFATADELSGDRTAFAGALAGRSIVTLFEKPSLRTRVTFEVGPTRLGAHVLYFDHAKQRIGEREPIVDYAKNLERWTDAIVARTFADSTVRELARHADVPVINALTEAEHPCQALADFFTLHQRFGSAEGRTLAYVGDGNNVCHSLLLLGAVIGAHVVAVTPEGHEPNAEGMARAHVLAEGAGGSVRQTHDLAGVEGADGVYADTWVSMGDADSAARRALFESYRVTQETMDRAGPEAVFMHCLPAARGVEVTADVIDGPNSVVYDQAENRMHAQNALLLHLLVGVRGADA